MDKILISKDKFFISSDYHLGHKNVLTFDQRPFDNIELHDFEIIKRHNDVVKKNDCFFFLGDFSLNIEKEQIENYISQLNGNLFFIKGNHDNTKIIELYKKYGIYLGEQFSSLYVGESYRKSQKIVINHFKMLIWDKSYRSSWHLYGHSHGSSEHLENEKSLDVGIMLNNYYPFNYTKIDSIMNNKTTSIL